VADHVTIHLHNAARGKDEALAEVFAGPHLEALRRLRGFKSAQRFEIAGPQVMAGIAQPWRYVSIYEFDYDDPVVHLPALGPLLADIRDAGMIAADEAERIHSFKMYAPWKWSGNYRPGPFTHIQLLIANFTPGREREYHEWYDEVHSVETSESPGFVGMRRGKLSPVQVPPYNFCYGSELILSGLQTDDLAFAVQDFRDRAMGKSASGVAWGPRSTDASQARTVHAFTSIAGPFSHNDI